MLNSKITAQVDNTPIVVINELIKVSDEANGLHSVDMFSMKKLGENKNFYADETGIHYTLIIAGKEKEQLFEFSELKKIVILRKEKAQYSINYKGDYHLLIHSKKVGKLLIIGVSESNMDRLVNSLKEVSPNIKKINYPK